MRPEATILTMKVKVAAIYLIFGTLAVVCQSSSELTIFVANGSDFMTQLCSSNSTLHNAKSNSSITLVLNPAENYTIRASSSPCVVKPGANSNLIIRSNSTLVTANVHCEEDRSGNISLNSLPAATAVYRTGWAFINSNVMILDVTFTGCGTTIKSFNTSRVNSSKLIFKENHSTAFLFISCSLNLTNVHINKYYGFAIVSINLLASKFSKLNITENIHHDEQEPVGSGILLLFTGYVQSNVATIVVFNDCKFSKNIDDTTSKTVKIDSIASHFFSKDTRQVTIIHAAALTVIFDQHMKKSETVIPPVISIQQTIFNTNTGRYAGGLMILDLAVIGGEVIISDNTSFQENTNTFPRCQGSAVAVYIATGEQQEQQAETFITPLTVRKTNFHKNAEFQRHNSNDQILAGAIHIAIENPTRNMIFYFEGALFKSNTGINGACLFAEVYRKDSNAKITIILQSTSASYNNQNIPYLSITGIFVMKNIDKVIINGTKTTFTNNIGSVIYSLNTHIHLYGNITFYNNKAISGPAFHMKESYLYFNEMLHVVLKENRAYHSGGAIRIANMLRTTAISDCALIFSSSSTSVVIFNNNTADKRGDSVSAFPIYSCHSSENSNNKTAITIHSLQYYLNHTKILNSNHASGLLDISSEPCYFIIDDNSTANQYPGRTIQINMAAFDCSGNGAYSEITVSLVVKRHGRRIIENKSHIARKEEQQLIYEKKRYTPINVTVFHKDADAEQLKFYVLFLIKRSLNSTLHSLDMLPSCPTGFELDRKQGKCICSKAVIKYYKFMESYTQANCDINTLTISRPEQHHFLLPTEWIGTISKNVTDFAVSYTCPLEFCRPNSDASSSFKLNEQTGQYFILIDSSKQAKRNICRHHREGVLCSKCEEGYSVVFGSGQCKKCSNWWLLTLVIYTIAGPLLIYLLYTLKLTLTTGTLNGIIFYAQVANLGLLQLMLYIGSEIHYSSVGNFLSVFLSLLNLNLGFPLCLYDGMNNFSKTILNFAFPIYLQIIVAGLIIASRRSLWLSNKTSHSSVQVLVTVVHISLTQLLISTINIFKSVKIFTANTKDVQVWFKDGTIDFNSSDQRLIIAMATSLTVSTVFFLPYLSLLIGGKYIIRTRLGNQYFRSTYEAIHGPYKENRRCWFTARFLLLIAMIIVYTVFRSRYISLIGLISIPLLICFLLVQTYRRPFKNGIINILDVAITLDLILVYIVSFYMIFTGTIQKMHGLVMTLVFMIFLTFLGIILYHVFFIAKPIKCKPAHGNIYHRLRKLVIQQYNRYFKDNSKSSLAMSEASILNYNSCDNFREPVIGYTD